MVYYKFLPSLSISVKSYSNVSALGSRLYICIKIKIRRNSIQCNPNVHITFIPIAVYISPVDPVYDIRELSDSFATFCRFDNVSRQPRTLHLRTFNRYSTTYCRQNVRTSRFGESQPSIFFLNPRIMYRLQTTVNRNQLTNRIAVYLRCLPTVFQFLVSYSPSK